MHRFQYFVPKEVCFFIASSMNLLKYWLLSFKLNLQGHLPKDISFSPGPWFSNFIVSVPFMLLKMI